MMYLFHGTDGDKVRAKAFEWIAKAREKEPGLAYRHLLRDELSTPVLEDIAYSGGLFVRRLLILIDDPFSSLQKRNEKPREEGEEGGSENILEEHLDLLAESDNAIIILAPELPAAKARKIETRAAKTYVFNVSALPYSRGFNSALVNALAARDSKRLWLEVVRALRAGDAPEMIHGLLHWKARDLMENGSRTWKPEEARALSVALIELTRHARRTGVNFGDALERFALSI